MLHRRPLLAALAASAITPVAARAQGVPSELTYAAVPGENSTATIDRFSPFLAYLSKEIGIPVKLRLANDYAAVIEGQRAGNIHIGYHGSAGFARARMTGVAADAFVIDVNADGTKGYNAVFYVRADSPYQTIADLKGINLGLVDPNSNSGYNMPMFTLNKQGIPAPDKFFANVLMTGSHENAIIALVHGTVDVATNWWNTDDDSSLSRMLNKGMLRDAKGAPMRKQDFRIILTSDLLINPPTAYLTSLPEDLKAKIRGAFLTAHLKDKAAFDRLSDGKAQPWQAVDNAAFDETIALIRFVDALRKRAG